MPTWPQHLRDIPDFPRAGILFKDISPVLANPQAFAEAIAALATPWQDQRLDAIIGIESRGFILAAAMAHALGVGFIPARKPGKLPGRTIGIDYGLEYGRDRLELQADALVPGTRVLVVDDVLATGGTLKAAVALARQLQADVLAACVLIELQDLQARRDWDPSVPLLATWRC